MVSFCRGVLCIVAKGTGQVNPKGNAGRATACFRPPLSGMMGEEPEQEDAMTREELTREVRKAAENDRLSCEAAHRLSGELKIPLSEIGALCNELKIRITSCQLGCF